MIYSDFVSKLPNYSSANLGISATIILPPKPKEIDLKFFSEIWLATLPKKLINIIILFVRLYLVPKILN